jgi:hypothetical protein
MKRRTMDLSVLILLYSVGCILGLHAAVAIAGEPTIQCSDFAGCVVENGIPQEFIEQIKNEGNLGKNSLLLSKITPDDLIMLQQLKDDLSVSRSKNRRR